MLNLTNDYNARGMELHPGEHIWRTVTGRLYKVYSLKDEVASKHGGEVLRMFATALNEDGSVVIRADGKPATDEHGHTLVRLNHDVTRKPVPGPDHGTGEEPEHLKVATKGEQISFREHYMSELEAYLARMDIASDNHAEFDDLADLFVNSSEAHHIPEHLKHLRSYVDEYGHTKHH